MNGPHNSHRLYAPVQRNRRIPHLNQPQIHYQSQFVSPQPHHQHTFQSLHQSQHQPPFPQQQQFLIIPIPPLMPVYNPTIPFYPPMQPQMQQQYQFMPPSQSELPLGPHPPPVPPPPSPAAIANANSIGATYSQSYQSLHSSHQFATSSSPVLPPVPPPPSPGNLQAVQQTSSRSSSLRGLAPSSTNSMPSPTPSLTEQQSIQHFSPAPSVITVISPPSMSSSISSISSISSSSSLSSLFVMNPSPSQSSSTTSRTRTGPPSYRSFETPPPPYQELSGIVELPEESDEPDEPDEPDEQPRVLAPVEPVPSQQSSVIVWSSPQQPPPPSLPQQQRQLLLEPRIRDLGPIVDFRPVSPLQLAAAHLLPDRQQMTPPPDAVSAVDNHLPPATRITAAITAQLHLGTINHILAHGPSTHQQPTRRFGIRLAIGLIVSTFIENDQNLIQQFNTQQQWNFAQQYIRQVGIHPVLNLNWLNQHFRRLAVRISQNGIAGTSAADGMFTDLDEFYMSRLIMLLPDYDRLEWSDLEQSMRDVLTISFSSNRAACFVHRHGILVRFIEIVCDWDMAFLIPTLSLIMVRLRASLIASPTIRFLASVTGSIMLHHMHLLPDIYLRIGNLLVTAADAAAHETRGAIDIYLEEALYYISNYPTILEHRLQTPLHLREASLHVTVLFQFVIDSIGRGVGVTTIFKHFREPSTRLRRLILDSANGLLAMASRDNGLGPEPVRSYSLLQIAAVMSRLLPDRSTEFESLLSRATFVPLLTEEQEVFDQLPVREELLNMFPHRANDIKRAVLVGAERMLCDPVYCSQLPWAVDVSPQDIGIKCGTQAIAALSSPILFGCSLTDGMLKRCLDAITEKLLSPETKTAAAELVLTALSKPSLTPKRARLLEFLRSSRARIDAIVPLVASGKTPAVCELAIKLVASNMPNRDEEFAIKLSEQLMANEHFTSMEHTTVADKVAAIKLKTYVIRHVIPVHAHHFGFIGGMMHAELSAANSKTDNHVAYELLSFFEAAIAGGILQTEQYSVITSVLVKYAANFHGYSTRTMHNQVRSKLHAILYSINGRHGVCDAARSDIGKSIGFIGPAPPSAPSSADGISCNFNGDIEALSKITHYLHEPRPGRAIPAGAVLYIDEFVKRLFDFIATSPKFVGIRAKAAHLRASPSHFETVPLDDGQFDCRVNTLVGFVLITVTSISNNSGSSADIPAAFEQLVYDLVDKMPLPAFSQFAPLIQECPALCELLAPSAVFLVGLLCRNDQIRSQLNEYIERTLSHCNNLNTTAAAAVQSVKRSIVRLLNLVQLAESNIYLPTRRVITIDATSLVDAAVATNSVKDLVLLMRPFALSSMEFAECRQYARVLFEAGQYPDWRALLRHIRAKFSGVKWTVQMHDELVPWQATREEADQLATAPVITGPDGRHVPITPKRRGRFQMIRAVHYLIENRFAEAADFVVQRLSEISECVQSSSSPDVGEMAWQCALALLMARRFAELRQLVDVISAADQAVFKLFLMAYDAKRTRSVVNKDEFNMCLTAAMTQLTTRFSVYSGNRSGGCSSSQYLAQVLCHAAGDLHTILTKLSAFTNPRTDVLLRDSSGRRSRLCLKLEESLEVRLSLLDRTPLAVAIMDAVCTVTDLIRHDDYMTRKLLKYGVPDAVLFAYPDLSNCELDGWLYCINAHTLKLRQLPVPGYSELHAVELFLAQLKQWRADRVFAVGEDEPTPLSDMDNERLNIALAPLYQILAVSPAVSVDARFKYSRRAIRGFNCAATSANAPAEDKAASAKFLVDNLRSRQVLMPIQSQQHQDQPRHRSQQQQQQQQQQPQPEFQLESLPAEFQAFAHNARNHAREEAIRAGVEPPPHLDDPVYQQQVRRQVQARLQQHRPAHPPHPAHPAPAIPPRQHFQVQWEHDHHNHVETAAMEALAAATRYAVREPHSDDAAHSLRRLMALFVQDGHHMQRNVFFLNGIRDIPLGVWIGNGIFSRLLHRVDSMPRTLQLVVRDVGSQLITRSPHDVAIPLFTASARPDTTPAARELLDALITQLKSQHPQLFADHQRFLSSIKSLAQPPVKTLLAFFTPRVLAVLRCRDPQHTSQQTTALINAAADIYNYDPELFARYSHSASVNRAASFATSTASTREDSSDVTSTTSGSSEDSSSEIRQPAGLPPSPFERDYLYHFCDSELRAFIRVYDECIPVAHNEQYFRLRDVMRTLHAKLQRHADIPQDDIEHGIAAMNESLHNLTIRVPGTLPVTSSTILQQIRNVTISSIRIGSDLAHADANTRILRVHGSDNSVRAFSLCHHKHASRESLAQDFTRIINNIVSREFDAGAFSDLPLAHSPRAGNYSVTLLGNNSVSLTSIPSNTRPLGSIVIAGHRQRRDIESDNVHIESITGADHAALMDYWRNQHISLDTILSMRHNLLVTAAFSLVLGHILGLRISSADDLLINDDGSLIQHNTKTIFWYDSVSKSRLLNPVVATAIDPASLLPGGLFCQVAERIYGVVVRNRYEIWQMLAASTEVPQAEIDRLRRHLDELILEQPLPEGHLDPHPQSFKDILRQCIADAGY